MPSVPDENAQVLEALESIDNNIQLVCRALAEMGEFLMLIDAKLTLLESPATYEEELTA